MQCSFKCVARGMKKNKQFRHSQIYSINLQKNITGFNLKPKGLRLALLRGDVVSREAKSVHLSVVGTACIYNYLSLLCKLSSRIPKKYHYQGVN